MSHKRQPRPPKRQNLPPQDQRRRLILQLKEVFQTQSLQNHLLPAQIGLLWSKNRWASRKVNKPPLPLPITLASLPMFHRGNSCLTPTKMRRLRISGSFHGSAGFQKLN